MDERRLEPRAPIDVEVTARTAKALLYHPLLNISMGGVCIELGEPLEEGTEIELRFVLPYKGALVAAEGKVAWCLEMKEGSLWNAGITFTRFDPQDVEKIRQFTTILLKVVRPAGTIED